MTQDSSKPSSPKSERKLKTLIFQGIVGAVTLAGTTAIPLIIQKLVNPPSAPPAAPAVSTQQITPSPAQVEPAAPTASPEAQNSRSNRDKKEKGRSKD